MPLVLMPLTQVCTQLQAPTFTCLLNVSTWMSGWHATCSMAKSEF